MARTVFFSFDYDDVFKVNQVRNSGVFVGVQRSGFRDKAEYEKVKKTGNANIQRWIQRQMVGCSVTCVLIGRQTYQSRWVNYEIQESISNRMGLLGIYINHLNDPTKPDDVGFFAPPNPLDEHTIQESGLFGTTPLTTASDKYETHTWNSGDSLLSLLGGNSLGDWVDEAARIAGR